MTTVWLEPLTNLDHYALSHKIGLSNVRHRYFSSFLGFHAHGIDDSHNADCKFLSQPYFLWFVTLFYGNKLRVQLRFHIPVAKILSPALDSENFFASRSSLHKKILEDRLDSRVNAMMETGLVQELLDFHRRYNEQRIKSNARNVVGSRSINSIPVSPKLLQKILEDRLDSRVNAMMETGLVQELLDFHRRYNEQRIKSNA
ncbi:tRNA dimethylallyltransferase, mitochondrial [Eufriesea mexicana]|uniref:tRNA dimethylallyltransferase, mitochondrial n=1 Tax=Eufriesea mexicana TaxID=516756 RepID=A0A310SIT4_9HYME|nr:tRNA dimethylallyltransferase, mitochondrial [Eufriesea mexicana]